MSLPLSVSDAFRLQSDNEGRSESHGTFHSDFSAHIVDNHLADGQSETTAATVYVSVLFQTVEVEEQRLDLVLRDSKAVVTNTNLENDISLIYIDSDTFNDTYVHVDFRSLLAELERV